MIFVQLPSRRFQLPTADRLRKLATAAAGRSSTFARSVLAHTPDRRPIGGSPPPRGLPIAGELRTSASTRGYSKRKRRNHAADRLARSSRINPPAGAARPAECVSRRAADQSPRDGPAL